ncbi:MAG: [Alphaproteobacteria bacterium]|nr:[FeFe] hydrogenase H-cluster maturation GTPase HydF [Alphaproteobacteria bacterium]
MNNILPHQGLRSVVAIIGDTNSGKSLLINKLTGQDVSIVSDVKGTTTDAVSKGYELIGFGAISFYDTAGFNDDSELGQKRVKATKKVIYKSDLVLVVVGKDGLSNELKKEIDELKQKDIPYIMVYNFMDEIEYKKETDGIMISAKTGENIELLRDEIIKKLKNIVVEPPLIADKISQGDVVVLVTPIDEAAPKGRLIMPQVQTIREVLDSNGIAIITKENKIDETLKKLKDKPSFVITDSQVVKKVSETVDEDIKLTTFSTLFARYKGDFKVLYEGANKLDDLKDGDKILIAEGCAHRVTCNDIGRVKIPNMIRNYSKKELVFDVVSGADFKDNLDEYALVIHCGGCMLNRMEIIRRIHECVRAKTKITNYGMLISKIQGVFDRVVKDLI